MPQGKLIPNPQFVKTPEHQATYKIQVPICITKILGLHWGLWSFKVKVWNQDQGKMAISILFELQKNTYKLILNWKNKPKQPNKYILTILKFL